ncbi:MAG TPA: ACT domain-containing protein [Oscillospiraceae bacterium]|nr:ACT domain-containing protein [Oscillospiraceae bacterium]
MNKQVSVFLENKQGRLRDVLKLLADNNIDIRALTIAETADYGVLRLIVDNTERTVEAFRKNNFRTNITDVIIIEIQDISGSMYSFVNMLYRHGINVEYAYTCIPTNLGKYAFVIRVNDDKMEEALEIIKNCNDVEMLQ